MTSELTPNASSNVGEYLTLDEVMAELRRPQPWHRRARNQIRWRWQPIRRFPAETRYAWQRARRGYSEQDTWSFDGYLAKVILGGVRLLRERAICYPHDLTPEKWDTILCEIEAGMEAYLARDYAMNDAQRKKFERAMRLLAKHWESLWD